jgi:glycerophosphoryl diester phosphodiesterase
LEIAFTLFFIGGSYNFYLNQLEFSPHRIAHAGGSLNEVYYTNSLSAMTHNYKKGFVYFEVDLSLTADGDIVCVHDWFGIKGPIDWNGVPSTANFRKVVAESTYKPCTIGSLEQWLRQYPETKLITDAKADNYKTLKMIASAYPWLIPRIIPHIYKPEEFDPIRALGYNDIIWILYKYEGSEKDVLNNVARFRQPFAISLGVKHLRRRLQFVLRQFNKDLVIYAYTVNSLSLACKLINYQSITEVYSDALSPKESCDADKEIWNYYYH